MTAFSFVEGTDKRYQDAFTRVMGDKDLFNEIFQYLKPPSVVNPEFYGPEALPLAFPVEMALHGNKIFGEVDPKTHHFKPETPTWNAFKDTG